LSVAFPFPILAMRKGHFEEGKARFAGRNSAIEAGKVCFG